LYLFSRISFNEYLTNILWIELSERSFVKGSPYIMIKEIHEQPSVIERIIRSSPDEYKIAAEMIFSAKKVFVTGSGSSYHAGMFLDLLLKRKGLNSRSFVSGDYDIYRNLVDKESVVIAISQSGYTTDTLEAVSLFKKQGAKIIGVTNVIDSPLAQTSDHTIYVKAGREEAVTATKSFSAQITSLLRIYIEIFRSFDEKILKLETYLNNLPKLFKEYIYKTETYVRDLVEHVYKKDHMYILGRGLNYVSALESALKLKETCGIHSEAMYLTEIRHGPKAAVDESYMIGMFINENDLEIALKIIEELKDSEAVFLASIPEGLENKIMYREKIMLFNISLEREMPEEIRPLLDVLIYQLLSYYIAVSRMLDPDRPRRLRKVVI
jgi:glucosamine--fructose-6-phosphate aminotransferase (isomerizing)